MTQARKMTQMAKKMVIFGRVCQMVKRKYATFHYFEIDCDNVLWYLHAPGIGLWAFNSTWTKESNMCAN